jgi:hypothetical protein
LINMDVAHYLANRKILILNTGKIFTNFYLIFGMPNDLVTFQGLILFIEKHLCCLYKGRN